MVAVVVSLAGSFGSSVGDWRALALDRAAELGSAFVRPPSETSAEPVLRPPSPDARLASPPRQGVTSYAVKDGDSVSSVAEWFGISVQTLLWANGLSDDAVLAPGQALKILPVSGVLHTVQAGETLDDIARRYQSDRVAIVEFNQFVEPTRVAANDIVVVPGGRQEERPRPAPSARRGMRSFEDNIPQSDTGAPAQVAAVSAQPKALEASTYTAAHGDSLASIAGKFGISVETLMWANGLQDNPGLIAEGQNLVILPVSGAFHTVAAGETLLEVAYRYGVEGDRIVEANGLSSPDDLVIGQKLIVPDAKLASAEEVAAEARARAARAAALAGPKYVVAPGDSLNSIAYRFGVEPSAIVRVNGLSSADFLSVGQSLVVPGGRSSARAPASPAAAPRPAAAAAPAPAPASASGDGNRIVTIASKFLGYPYSWGGHSPGGFDCTGFTWYVYQQAGIRIPQHDLWGQLQAGPRINQASLLPGDLVFFQNTYQPGLSHSGIYIGGGRFINAEDYGKGVRVANMYDSYWGPRYFGASRPW